MLMTKYLEKNRKKGKWITEWPFPSQALEKDVYICIKEEILKSPDDTDCV